MMDESIEAECDEEIARISSQAQSRHGGHHHQISGSGRGTLNHQQNGQVPSGGDSGYGVSGRHDPPRPMSWDGGLSDTENSENDVGVEVEIKEEIEDVEFSSPKPSSAFVISNNNVIAGTNSSPPQPTNLTAQSGKSAHTPSSLSSAAQTPASGTSSSSSVFQSQSQSHSFYITHSPSQQRASSSAGAHTTSDPQTVPTDFSVSGSANSQQQHQSRAGTGAGNGTAPSNLPLMQLQLQMQQNAQMCNFSGIQQNGANSSSVTNASSPPQLPSSLPPTSTLNNNIIINSNNSSTTSTVANSNNNSNNSNSPGVLSGSGGNNNTSVNNNSSPSAPNIGLNVSNGNNSTGSSPGGNLLSTIINGSSTSGGVISNIVSNNSTNISSGGMLLQQQPPMNLSFPRIPPSPDSALGGWSTPSSNLSSYDGDHPDVSGLYSKITGISRHNSDASQRSFSSSSNNTTPPSPSNSPLLSHNRVVNKCDDYDGDQPEVLGLSSNITSQGISRQQLINSPCPICGDRISGFHYGIFSCESCKGFFKRTVQNRKNYICLRGGMCHVAIATRKKCPACRFDKCLRVGMKLEAIREDRTRGGRSTYACSYALPPTSTGASQSEAVQQNQPPTWEIPNLLKEIVECESLWHLSADGDPENDLGKEPSNGANSKSADYVAELCAAADRRLYKLVKWCKSLPLFKTIQVEDQTNLLLNSWCELLLFSCCYRSIPMPAGNIRINERLTLKEEDAHGNQSLGIIMRMIHFCDNLRRLRLDTVEYAALKVIILMSSEVDELQEGEKVRESQERLLQCLQAYTLARCPESPSKFGELLLKIPELQRICQVGKEMLTAKAEDTGFNLLFELLRGDH